MKNLVLLIVIILIGWYASQKYRAHTDAENQPDGVFGHHVQPLKPAPLTATQLTTAQPPDRFHCDGREYCSQMTSCEEATFFIRNCPNTKMDGNHDGVPCEKQWCK